MSIKPSPAESASTACGVFLLWLQRTVGVSQAKLHQISWSFVSGGALEGGGLDARRNAVPGIARVKTSRSTRRGHRSQKNTGCPPSYPPAALAEGAAGPPNVKTSLQKGSSHSRRIVHARALTVTSYNLGKFLGETSVSATWIRS